MFSRIANLFKGFLSLFISGIERQNPKALIEAEKENLRKQIARFNDNLANHAGLLRAADAPGQEPRDAGARPRRQGRGQPQGRQPQRRRASTRCSSRRSRSSSRRTAQQLEAAEETYKKLVQARDVSVRDAQAKIEKLKRMMTETEMLEAQAELQEMATGMISSIGGSGDTLDRVEEYLTERRDKAAGRARVAATLDRHLQGGAHGGRAAGARRPGADRVRGGLRPRGAGAARAGRGGPRRRRPPRTWARGEA